MNDTTRTCAVCGCSELAACHDDLRGACWWVSERLCSHCAQPDARRSLALVAADQLSDVVAELLRFVREGDQETFTPFCLEPAENTADALRKILLIQSVPGGFAEEKPLPPIDSDTNQMLGAIERFIEAWA